MTAHVTLVVADWCPVCPRAKELWRSLRQPHDFHYNEVDIASPDGEERAARYNLLSVPTTVIDDRVAFVGVPPYGEAMQEVTTT